MGKLFITLIIFLIVMQNIVAVRINEIEINPLKGRAGVEWIELYNEGSDINLAGWSIYDGLASSKKRYTFLDGATIKKHKYYVIELKSSVLNNNGDFVILYDKKNKLIDKTKTLKDLEGNSKTWQLCGKDWKFETETKGKKNKCKTKSAYHQEEQKIQYKKDNESFFNKTIKKSKIIKLNPKDIKTNKINNIINKRDYPFYGLILFSALLPILFILKFRKSKKMNSDEKKINAMIILEILGRPPEYLVNTLEQIINQINKEKGLRVLNKKINKPILVKDQKDIYTTFAEVEIKADELIDIISLIFKYMPANIEITSPSSFNITNIAWGELLNEVTRRLHSYDEIAKVLMTEKAALEKKLIEIQKSISEGSKKKTKKK